MSIRHLRTLLAIAERGSFAAAARQVNLTESAVSMQMKALEQELGTVLFDRSSRPPALTDAARALLAEAEELVAGYERLTRRKGHDSPVEGLLRLGAVPSVITADANGMRRVVRTATGTVTTTAGMAMATTMTTVTVMVTAIIDA